MVLSLNVSTERQKISRLLSEVRKERCHAIGAQDPGRKMEAAFVLSVEARKMLIAGLQAQGFVKAEIQAILRKRRR